jgi:hypothetical protein
MKILKAQVGPISAELIYKGTKVSKWGADKLQRHILNMELNSKKMQFDFWQSKAKPKADSTEDVIFAVYCVLSDALAYLQNNDLLSFMNAFGYTDKLGAESVFNSCVETYEKLENAGMNEDSIIELLNNELSEC